MTILTVASYDGHAINDGSNYAAWMPWDAFDPPLGNVQQADVNFSYPVYTGNKKQTKDGITIYIQVLNAATEAAFLVAYHQLNGWFNTQDGGEKELLTTWVSAPTTRRLLVRPMSIRWPSKSYCVVTLKALKPLWEDNSVTATSWTVAATGATKTITNAGNVNVAPVFRIQVTTAALNGWRWKKPVIVRNATTARLRNYPLEVAGGTDWDTTALVANAAKTCLINMVGNLSAAATTIVVDTPGTASFYTSGWVYIGTEQIFYTGTTATQFTGCVRGVNGTSAAIHLDDVVVYQSEMAADGSDISVEIDGVEMDRWFGGATGAAGGPNSTTTKVWVNFPDIPAKPSGESASIYQTLGTDLAQTYGTASASSAHADGGGASSVLSTSTSQQSYWLAKGISPQWIAVDLGSAREVNTVRLQMPSRSDGGFRNFEIEASSDNWATHVSLQTVTDTPQAHGQPQWQTFTIDAVTYRYWRIYVNSIWSDNENHKAMLHHFCIYNAQANAYLKYGNPAAVRRADDATRKPMFELDHSSNTSWVYETFYDVDRVDRPAQWKSVQYNGTRSEQRVYSQAGDGGGVAAVKNQSYEAGYDADVALSGSVAQTFTPTVTGELSSVELSFTYAIGNKTLVCDIYSVIGGVWTNLGSIGATHVLADGFAVFNRTESQAIITLTSGVVYAIRPYVSGMGYGFTSTWRADASAPAYAGGSRFDYAAGVWTAAAGTDFLFRVNIVVGRSSILGVATKTVDTTVFANGWYLNHPCGFSAIVFTGSTKQYPTYRVWSCIATSATGARKTLYGPLTDTHTTFTAIGPLTYPISPAAVSIVFAHVWLLSSTADNYGEVTDVTLTLSTPPTVETQTALGTASIHCQLINTTADPDESIFITGLIPLNTAVDVNCEAHQISEVLTGVEHAGWISTDAVRDFWLELLPGDNVLQLNDESIVGLSIETRYRSRWI